jgi:hypothetical protein
LPLHFRPRSRRARAANRATFLRLGNSYRLSVYADPDDPAPWCVFADKVETAFINGGNPHAELLYYRLPTGRVEFGTIYIALEDLR